MSLKIMFAGVAIYAGTMLFAPDEIVWFFVAMLGASMAIGAHMWRAMKREREEREYYERIYP